MSVIDNVLREAERLPFLCAVSPTGQHHVNHPSRANQARYAHGTTAANKYAARALWQSVVRAAFSDPDMCSSGELQTAADDGAVQYSDDRHIAILNQVKSAVPGPRTANAGGRAEIRDGRKIDTG